MVAATETNGERETSAKGPPRCMLEVEWHECDHVETLDAALADLEYRRWVRLSSGKANKLRSTEEAVVQIRTLGLR